MLEAAIFFKGFPVSMASSLRQVLQTYSEICFFCSAIRYIVSKKQPVGSAYEVLTESLETVFDDEAHFIVKLYNFLQPLALPRHPFPQTSHFSPISPGRTTSKIPLLYTLETALVCIFSSILNHRWENQKNSIIKG